MQRELGIMLKREDKEKIGDILKLIRDTKFIYTVSPNPWGAWLIVKGDEIPLMEFAQKLFAATGMVEVDFGGLLSSYAITKTDENQPNISLN